MATADRPDSAYKSPSCIIAARHRPSSSSLNIKLSSLEQRVHGAKPIKMARHLLTQRLRNVLAPNEHGAIRFLFVAEVLPARNRFDLSAILLECGFRAQLIAA